MKSLRIVIADDHEIVRRGLRSLLEAQPGWQVVAEAMTGREAVARIAQLKPDVVVMDISMPEMNGLEATRQVLKRMPKTEILILTMHESEQVVREVLEAGLILGKNRLFRSVDDPLCPMLSMHSEVLDVNLW